MLTNLVEYVVKKIVDNPDAVSITSSDVDGTNVIRLKVADEDIGKVIGKAGKTARALRFLVNAAAAKTNQKATIEIDK